jgi:hypothetical protein
MVPTARMSEPSFGERNPAKFHRPTRPQALERGTAPTYLPIETQRLTEVFENWRPGPVDVNKVLDFSVSGKPWDPMGQNVRQTRRNATTYRI